MANPVQVAVFLILMAVLAGMTWRKVAAARAASHASADKEIFLAGGGLSWFFVAGAITLTNLSTDQLVGMNGAQMLLVAWWELAGFVGLLMLAFVFVPIYYRNNCTTVTELLEKRYDGASIRTVISGLFLAGNILIYLPAVIYSGSLFTQTVFGTDLPLLVIAAVFAVVGASYAILGGLRAVAVLDTYSGIGILGLALVVVFLALQAINFDFSGIPAERLSMVGDNDSQIPFHTLFTGMLFIQIFYWSTNQNITQKALAAPNVKEAQKGIIAAAIIRVLIVPPIVVVPGVVAFKLFGGVGDEAYGMLVGEVLPSWTSGLFAAMIAAAVLTTYSAVMNATITLWSVDFHRKFINPEVNVVSLNRKVGIGAMIISIALVPIYANAESIIDLLQQLNGLLSMPILSAFAAALLFRNMDARAAVSGLIYGVAIYALHTFYLYTEQGIWGGTTFYRYLGLDWLHYIDVMVFVLFSSIIVSLLVNRIAFGQIARPVWKAANT
ncbi:SLC5 family protein [Altererythrobacter sp.]|uniref:sodium:solute symporter family transporter n=1 Tax=Altererythrobacter sp. TaxID=1872480 RepID=UPI001B1EC4C2|nr:SLC5 family protein [Altererythrobacter sp.]MBO6609560.1 SLC5 family protein [Altererythrobacter sp.]MBO6641827.1 SLC5 family protein [Altererythrobacter sp.]MBO6709785.1 SLC5 family protein [Altererythrobacter sp.]MBO6944224.1 SLC5 family protein [Altererythrobacter sp.]